MDLIISLKATAAALTEGVSYRWTGATVIRTVSAEELGEDADRELLYFQLDSNSALAASTDRFWMSSDGLDEVSQADMEDYMAF